MHFVYILQSESNSDRYYTGYTQNIEKRILDHNQGKNLSTRKYRPWELKSFVAFPEKERAIKFERYLKTGSGRAMAIKHL